MATHTFTVRSPHPPAEVFARMVDLERVPEWDDGISGSSRIGAAEILGDEEILGARFEVGITGFDGRPATAIYEITDVDAPRRFVMVGTGADFQAVDEVTIAPNDSADDGAGDGAGEDAGGCTMTYVAGLELTGDDAPMTEAQLDALFPKIVAVAEAGLTRFLDGR